MKFTLGSTEYDSDTLPRHKKQFFIGLLKAKRSDQNKEQIDKLILILQK